MLNALAHVRCPITLILDQYEHIRETSIHKGLALLIDHAPPTLHVVMASRSRPPLPLERWRVRRYLQEIDANALRFSSSESTHYVSQALGRSLTDQEADGIECALHGWPAGLQLLRCALEQASAPVSLAEDLAPYTPLILDYLIEDVVKHQPPTIQTWLAGMAVVERMSPLLCEALVGTSVGSLLDRGDLLIMPLAETPGWYRYHPMMRAALVRHLDCTESHRRSCYHQRAATWLSEHGYTDERAGLVPIPTTSC